MRLFASLRQTLSLSFLAVATLPILLLGLFGFEYFKRQQLELFAAHIDTHVRNVQQEASEYLQENLDVLTLVESAVGSSLLHEDSEVTRFLQLSVDNALSFESIYLLDKERRITHFALAKDYPGHKDDYLGLDFSNHEIFSAQPTSFRLTWSNTFISVVTGEPSITFSLEIDSGILLGTVSLKKLSSVMAERLNATVRENMDFSLLDKRGLLIADSQPSRVEQRINLLSQLDVNSMLENSQVSSACLDKELGVLHCARVVPQVGWVAYASVPESVVLQAVQPLYLMLFSFLAAAAALGLLLSVWMSRRVLKPILMLQTTSSAVAQGDYDLVLPPAVYAELEELGVSFRRMVMAVHEREASLQESRQLYRNVSDRLQVMIDHMPLSCIMWDEELRVEHWNPAAEELFGFSREEAMGRSPFGFLLPDAEKDKIRELFQRLRSGDEMAHSINDNLTKSGQIVTCEWHNTPLRDVNGEISGFLSTAHDISRRMVAEKALRESEASFRTIFQTNPDAVMIVRASDGRILNVNENSVSLSGFSREELIGQTTLELGLWEEPESFAGYLAEIKAKGFINNFEMLVRRQDGRIRTGLASARTVQISDEECRMIVVRDITAMKDAERRVIRSEARFRSLISVMGQGLIILSRDGDIIQCNQAAEQILKLSREELLDAFYLEMLPEMLREDYSPCPLAERPAAVTMSTGESVSNQVLGLRRNGDSITWLQFDTHALSRDSHGRPIAIVVSFADVTRLKQIETNLRQSEEHLRAVGQQFQGLLRAIPDQIMVLDQNLSTVWLNWQDQDSAPFSGEDVGAALHCYAIAESPCCDADKTSLGPCQECPANNCFYSGRPESGQKETADGRTLSLRAFPVEGEAGEVVNVILIIQDITESLLMQEQNTRTGQLAALGELAAGVAHEINNPINGVINYAQLLLNKAAEDSREMELSRRIIREGERVATIVRELLYFAREESQEVSQTTIGAALDEALSLTRSHLRKEGVSLQVNLPENLPLIESRSHQIQQLFLNMISNARHALTEKYPNEHPDKILSVDGSVVEKSGNKFVRVRFRDQGVGIKPELLRRVLNPFVTTKPSGVGTGLGLSISHEIVKKHGGSLSIDSEEGLFTEVVIDLPAVGGS